MKNTLAFVVLAFISLNILGQVSKSESTTFFVNVYLNEQKHIRLENNLVDFEKVNNDTANLVNDHLLNSNAENVNVVYRIYADKTLSKDFIKMVDQKMLDGYNKNASSMHFLLENQKINLNVPNWFQKLEAVNLEKIKG
ncbi:hypothetical protein ULMS_26800 [Patiriisocius marinistellae]|uniref:Uncharacterized protein n=1 Tax=Patiriisocius marinistellae TaxID=2494560 RepID=A0A5J4G0Q5_9FLAO|nr:hypothetical protein [Patiriisocius marinistellae]GEQ87172.1 hypothetical protein ULMS_26800 [Patiriisocius marinistellae]